VNVDYFLQFLHSVLQCVESFELLLTGEIYSVDCQCDLIATEIKVVFLVRYCVLCWDVFGLFSVNLN